MKTQKLRTVRLRVNVEDCGIVYLVDKETTEQREPVQSAGIIDVEGGDVVILHIAYEWGPADFTVTVAADDPGPDFANYEDIAEVTLHSPSGLLEIGGFTYDSPVTFSLPPLPAGPGTYRVRYHVGAMDTEGAEEALDDHYLQIWPSPAADPAVVKSTTQWIEHVLAPEKATNGAVTERGHTTQTSNHIRGCQGDPRLHDAEARDHRRDRGGLTAGRRGSPLGGEPRNTVSQPGMGTLPGHRRGAASHTLSRPPVRGL